MYARHQAALAELTQAVLANTGLPTLMRQAATLAAHTLAVAYSAIWELRANHDTLVLRADVGWPEAAVERTIAVATSHIGFSVFGTTSAIVVDWLSETRFHQLPALRDHGVISSLAVVIPGPVHPFGSLSVDVTASRMFSDEEVRFVVCTVSDFC